MFDFVRVMTDARKASHAFKQRLAFQVQGLRRQQGAFDIVAALLVAVCDLVEEGLGFLLQCRVVRQQGVRRQVIEQAGGVLVEQRQVVLDTAGHLALADIAVDQAALRIAFKGFAPGRTKAGDGFFVDRKLARRQHRDLLELVLGALGFGVKAADRVDLVVEQIDAQRGFAAHREQVDQRAAHRKLAVRHDLRDSVVAGVFQATAEGIKVQLLADLEHQAVLIEKIRRQNALHQGGDRRDHDSALHLPYLVQGVQALRDQLGQRREHVVGQGFPVREDHHRQALLAEEKLQFGGRARRLLDICSDQQQWCLAVVGKVRQREAERGAGAAAPGLRFFRINGLWWGERRRHSFCTQGIWLQQSRRFSHMGLCCGCFAGILDFLASRYILVGMSSF